jgi:hypothetical protein
MTGTRKGKAREGCRVTDRKPDALSPMSRRQLLAGMAVGALSTSDLYRLVDRLAGAPSRSPARVPALPPEQHVLLGVREIVDNNVEVLVPPLHHEVITFELRTESEEGALTEAQAQLEETLAGLEGRYDPTPAGLGVTVAWGLPYFRRYVPEPADRYLPIDRRASRAKRRQICVLLPAIRFPSDPKETILERNDVAVLLRSDRLDAIEEAATELMALRFWRPTSIRRGFAGGGFDGGQSLPKQMAMAAGVPGAELVPETAELFLGFTSSQKGGLGPTRIANIETLRYSDGGRDGYFRAGTTMHLSHLREDLAAWYRRRTYDERLASAFGRGFTVPSGTLTIPSANPDAGPVDIAANKRDYRLFRAIGHSASLQPATRLQRNVRGADGTVYEKGTAIPHRADFNTLDNPFSWSAEPERDGMNPEPAAGVHFVVFHPTSDDFHRARLAMDGVMPDGTKLRLPPRSRRQGLNSVLRTTHRQNFLVPPRQNRSFPLAELLA